MHDNIVSLFGDKLAELIQKSPMASKGLIRFAIREYRKTNNVDYDVPLGMDEFDEIVSVQLHDLLKRANIGEADHIIESMLSEITYQQAIFTMTS